ncbi:MAG: hypothetical protein PVH00_15270 [Gemmatimonadota bacterium]|jgi:hypothetical protein
MNQIRDNGRYAAAIAGAIITLAGSAAHAGAQDASVLRPAASLETASFTRIRGLHELRDGRLLVSDQRENALWIVDLAVGAREKVGREGAGPDEYRNPIALWPFRGDSAILEDLGNGRLSFYGPDLRMGRTVPMFSVGGGLPDAADTLGRFYRDNGTSVRTARARDPAASDRAVIIRVRESAPGSVDTIDEVRIAGPPNPRVWYPWDAWAVGLDGRVFIVRNQDEYRVEWHLPDGRKVTGATLDDEQAPVTDEDRRLYSEAHPLGTGGAVSMGERRPARRPETDFPDRFPFTDPRNVWVDREGSGWVGRHEHQRERRPLFDVFDGAGRRVARVRLPEGRQVVGFGRGSLYAVRIDEVDLQWLERYDIRSLDGRS